MVAMVVAIAVLCLVVLAALVSAVVVKVRIARADSATMPPDPLYGLSSSTRLAVDMLDDDALQRFFSEWQPRQVTTAYVLSVLLGAHYFYLGRPARNILYWCSAGGLMVWAVRDWLHMPALVGECNNQQAIAILRVLSPANTFQR